MLFDLPIRPAAVDPATEALAARLPAGLRLGTSSWSFPGWAGLVWAHRAPADDLSRRGLPAYAAHPLLRTVSLDRSFYAPVPPDELRAYAAQVPDDFRFVAKLPAALGDRDGDSFLSPTLAADAAAALSAGLGARLGVLLLQLAPGDTVDDWPERLTAMLTALRGASDALIAVEPRFRGALGPGYAEALGRAGAAHCLSVHPAMPDLRTQWRDGGVSGAPALVARWNLTPNLRYADAKERFAPFDRLAAPDPDHRDALAKAARWALTRGRPVWITANNKAEGSAPRTLWALAERIDALGG